MEEIKTELEGNATYPQGYHVLLYMSHDHVNQDILINVYMVLNKKN